MKKNLLILSVTAALISACGSTPPTPVTLDTLTLGGVGSTLLISSNAKLTVNATGTDGQPFAGTPTFTSSAPSAIAVAGDGSLTVRHLSVAPVTLTATENGKTATVNVTTYGLDVVGGTYLTRSNAKAPGYQFLLAVRDASGNPLMADTSITIQGPVGFNGGAAITRTGGKGATPSSYTVVSNDAVPVVSGSYTASTTVAGTVFSRTFSIDATQVLPLASSVNLNVTASGYTASGTLPAGSPRLYGVVYSPSAIVAVTSNLTALPVSGTFTTPLTSGTYNTGVFAQDFLGPAGGAFPDQVNRSFNYLAPVTIP